MKDYLINELVNAVDEIEKQFIKVKNLKSALDEYREFEQVEIIGAKEVANMFQMSVSWAEGLIRDIKKKEGLLGAGSKIPKSALLRAIGHTKEVK